MKCFGIMGPLIWKLISFNAKTFAYVTSVIIVLPLISFPFCIAYELDVGSPDLVF